MKQPTPVLKTVAWPYPKVATALPSVNAINVGAGKAVSPSMRLFDVNEKPATRNGVAQHIRDGAEVTEGVGINYRSPRR